MIDVEFTFPLNQYPPCHVIARRATTGAYFRSGRSVAWYARLLGVQEVVSSNLTAPTIFSDFRFPISESRMSNSNVGCLFAMPNRLITHGFCSDEGAIEH